jgi:hypothetical protein
LISHHSEGSEVQDQGARKFITWWWTLWFAYNLCPTWHRGGLTSISYRRVLILSWGVPPSQFHPNLVASHWGLGFQHMNFDP